MIITRGFNSTTIVTRGYGGIILVSSCIYREVVVSNSKIRRTLKFYTRIHDGTGNCLH